MYDKYSELQRKYRIIDHTVRIEIVQSSSVGTGFLYTIRGSTYVYIMTACHVICRVFKYGAPVYNFCTFLNPDKT